MSDFFRIKTLANVVLFQGLWLAAVIGTAYHWLWPSLVLLVVLIAWQLQPQNRHPTDLRLVCISIVMGLVIDTAWVQFNLMEFTDQRPFSSASPIWIIALWIGFALTINHSMSWLKAHPLLPAIMGSISAPISYYAGLRLGAVKYLADPWLVSFYLGIVWAVALTLLVRISQRPQTVQAETVSPTSP